MGIFGGPQERIEVDNVWFSKFYIRQLLKLSNEHLYILCVGIFEHNETG